MPGNLARGEGQPPVADQAPGGDQIVDGLLRPAYRVDWYEVVGDVEDTKWPELMERARSWVVRMTAQPSTRSTRMGTRMPTERWTLERWEGAEDPPDLPKIWAIKPKFVVDGRRSCGRTLGRFRDEVHVRATVLGPMVFMLKGG